MEKNSKYYVGLDIGTSSVGFCATDENYNLINKKGRDLWGVMLFDEAQTAEKRRAKRCSKAKRKADAFEKFVWKRDW